MITQTPRPITDLAVLQILARALDELLGDEQQHGDIESPKLTAFHIGSLIALPTSAPVMSHVPSRRRCARLLRRVAAGDGRAAVGVLPGRAARVVHRLIDLKRRRLVTHERRSVTVDGVTTVTDLWAITLDGLAVARRGES